MYRVSISGYYHSVVKINFYFSFPVVKGLARFFSQPQAFNHVKLYNPVRVTVGFPNALGLPSLYTLNAPTVLKSSGELRLRSQPDLAKGSDDVIQIPDSMNITGDLHIA
jgi:hypothetical protein